MYLCLALAVLAIFDKFLVDDDFYVKMGYVLYQCDFFNLTYPTATGLSYTFWSEAFNTRRVAAFLANPIALGNLCLVLVPFFVSLFISKAKRLRFYHVLILALAVGTLVLSVTRSAIAVLPFQILIIIFIFQYYVKRKKIVSLIATIGVAIIVATSIVFLSTLVKVPVLHVFRDHSTLGHLIAWHQDYLLMKQNPYGYGIGSSGSVSVRYGVGIGSENQFLQIAIETGIVGFASYLFLVITIFYSTLKKLRTSELTQLEISFHMAVISVFAGVLAFSMTTLVWHNPFVAYFCWWILGYSEQLSENKPDLCSKSVL